MPSYLPLHLPLVPDLQSAIQPRFGWRSEESHGGGGAEDGVEVDARPDEEGVVQGEEDEGRGGEAEGGLGGEVGRGVVVGFVGRGAGAVGGEEEGADVAADVWRDVSVTVRVV